MALKPIPLNVSLDAPTLRAVKAVAAADNVTRSAVVRAALHRYGPVRALLDATQEGDTSDEQAFD